jgi:micrococcal nuclease
MASIMRTRSRTVTLLIGFLVAGCGGAASTGNGSPTEAPAIRPLAPAVTSAPSAKPALATATATAKPAPKPTPKPTKKAAAVRYENCAAARAAGAAPLHRGDPGYRSGLDRDGDGVACE